jgi:hypothetical protein
MSNAKSRLTSIFENVSACDLPRHSALFTRIQINDFVDCYRVRAVVTPRHAAQIITQFPQWAGFLLVIRRIVTAPFGLSQDGPAAIDKVGPFPVESESDDELLAGFNDKHLNFRVSVMAHDGHVYLATWVHPHNWGGRLYLRLIMPFHVLIARDALVRVSKQSRCSAQR